MHTEDYLAVEDVEKLVGEIVRAAKIMSTRKVGALIVIEGKLVWLNL